MIGGLDIIYGAEKNLSYECQNEKNKLVSKKLCNRLDKLHGNRSHICQTFEFYQRHLN